MGTGFGVSKHLVKSPSIAILGLAESLQAFLLGPKRVFLVILVGGNASVEGDTGG
jgi:hypothetical protein